MRVAFLYNDAKEDPSQQSDDDPENSPIVAAMERAGHDVTRIGCTLNLSTIRRQLEAVAPDVVFNRVDSLGGSDAMQSAVPMLLDVMDLPYTGCPTDAIVATASKVATKGRLVAAGMPTPGWVSAQGGKFGLRTADCRLTNWPNRGLGRPGSRQPAIRGPAQRAEGSPQFILKSIYEHASFRIGDASVNHSTSLEQIADGVRKCEAETGRPFFAEEYIDGREFNLALWGNEPELLPPAEIDFSTFPKDKPRIVGHRAKWDADSFEYDQTERLFDFPPSDGTLLLQLQELAVGCWRLFGLRGYARIDFRVDAGMQPWILEINTNPCLSPAAGFSAALEKAGIGYDEGIQQILEFAVSGSLQDVRSSA